MKCENVRKNVPPATKNRCIRYLSTAGLIVSVTPVKKTPEETPRNTN